MIIPIRRPYNDVAFPLDWKVKDKIGEIFKYQEIRIEIWILWNTAAKVIPIIVVGSQGATSMHFVKHLRKIPVKHNSPALIKSALLGRSNIQRRALDRL